MHISASSVHGSNEMQSDITASGSIFITACEEDDEFFFFFLSLVNDEDWGRV